MKTTVDLPDDLLIQVKKAAAERRTTIRDLVERGLRRELRVGEDAQVKSKVAIRWVTVKGGLPKGLDIASRAAMTDWLSRDRS